MTTPSPFPDEVLRAWATGTMADQMAHFPSDFTPQNLARELLAAREALREALVEVECYRELQNQNRCCTQAVLEAEWFKDEMACKIRALLPEEGRRSQ